MRVGVIYTELGKLLQINDGFTFGQKMKQIEVTLGSKFYDSTDEEVLKVLLFLNKTKEYYQDEPMSEEETILFLNTK